MGGEFRLGDDGPVTASLRDAPDFTPLDFWQRFYRGEFSDLTYRKVM